MASAFEAVSPLIEKFKKELETLSTASKKIDEATKSANANRITADEVVKAAKGVADAHGSLIKLLGEQQQGSLHDQETLLQLHLDELTQRTTTETTQQLGGLKQAGQAAQAVIDKLLAQQPPLLAAIKEQHEQGVVSQKNDLQKAAQAWADLLHQQMQTELKALRQAIEMLQGNTRRQHDDLSAITNQLQVATGRITAFAEAMNAAKFLTKLENLETGQREVGQALEKADKSASAGLQKIVSQAQGYQQQTTDSLQDTTNRLAELTAQVQQSDAEHSRQQAELVEALATATAQNQATSRQLRLLQIVSLVVSAATAALVCYFRYR